MVKNISKRKSAIPKRKETHPYRIGTKVFKVHKSTIRDIRKLQASTKCCLPKLPFSRVIREILMEVSQADTRLERKALLALQEAAEIYLTQLFEDSNLCANHSKRLTVRPIDMNLALTLRGVQDPGYIPK